MNNQGTGAPVRARDRKAVFSFVAGFGSARGSGRVMRPAGRFRSSQQSAAPGKTRRGGKVAKGKKRLQRGEDFFAGDALGSGDFAQDGVERADAQRLVIGDR